MHIYNVDIEVKGESFEFDTLYFNEETKGLIEKEWEENNIFMFFQRMKNNYLEVVKYLNFHTKPEENVELSKSKHRDNRDFTVLIAEIEGRVKDCDFYIENLVSNCKDPGFSAFVTNEFYRLEQDNHIVLQINNAIFPKS